MCLITIRVEKTIISIDSNITSNIITGGHWCILGKNVGPTMEPWRTLSLIGSSCKDLLSRTTWSRILLRKDNIRPNVRLYFYKTWVCEEDKHVKSCRIPWIYQVLQLEQPKTNENSKNFLHKIQLLERYNWYNWKLIKNYS